MTDKKTWSLTDPPEEPQTRGDATPLLVPTPVDPTGREGRSPSGAQNEGGYRGSPELIHQGPVLMGNPKGSRYTTGPSLFGQDEDVLERRRRRKILALVLFVLVLAALAAFVWLRRG